MYNFPGVLVLHVKLVQNREETSTLTISGLAVEPLALQHICRKSTEVNTREWRFALPKIGGFLLLKQWVGTFFLVYNLYKLSAKDLGEVVFSLFLMLLLLCWFIVHTFPLLITGRQKSRRSEKDQQDWHTMIRVQSNPNQRYALLWKPYENTWRMETWFSFSPSFFCSKVDFIITSSTSCSFSTWFSHPPTRPVSASFLKCALHFPHYSASRFLWGSSNPWKTHNWLFSVFCHTNFNSWGEFASEQATSISSEPSNRGLSLWRKLNSIL